MDDNQLELFLLSSNSVNLYLKWFRIRKVWESTLEQDIYEQCLLDKYRSRGLTKEHINCLRAKGIVPEDVYFPYLRETSLVIDDDRQIKAVYTGSHYDLVEEIPGVCPILLSSVEKEENVGCRLSI